ncbi:hypothetical protein V2G26_008121 [Clonostachys chloroleuca]
MNINGESLSYTRSRPRSRAVRGCFGLILIMHDITGARDALPNHALSISSLIFGFQAILYTKIGSRDNAIVNWFGPWLSFVVTSPICHP